MDSRSTKFSNDASKLIKSLQLYYFIYGDNIKIEVGKNYVSRKKYLERKMGIKLDIFDLYIG